MFDLKFSYFDVKGEVYMVDVSEKVVILCIVMVEGFVKMVC